MSRHLPPSPAGDRAPEAAAPSAPTYELLCHELRQQAELAEALSRTLRDALLKARELVEVVGLEVEEPLPRVHARPAPQASRGTRDARGR